MNDFHDIASYKCRPDGYQSQITFNKTTWKRWNNPFWTISTEQNPITFSLSHVTGAFPRPTPPSPYTVSIHTIRVQNRTDFHDIAWYKCRPDGYQSQITFDKTTWKRWNNPFWTIFTEQNPITFSLSHVTGAFPRPTPPPPYPLYTYNTRARYDFFFYDIASYKCRPDGYQSQITFNKTTWKRWNNPFWTISTEQNTITFSLSHVTGAFPRPTPPPPYPLYTYNTRARYDFFWYSFI